jgi:hypothetical protein
VLQEGVESFILPHQLRFLFARIIPEGYPGCPLWNSFSEHLSLDFIDATSSEQQGIDLALQDIADFLQDSGRSLTAYGLPEPLLCTVEVAMEHNAFIAGTKL